MGEIRIPRNMFLWSMTIVYMLVFASLYVQIPGLYGNDGVSPVRPVVPGASRDWGKPLLEQLQTPPLLLGLDTQQLMELLSLLGVLLALGAATLAPLRDSVVFLALWALYLSLCQVGGDFLSLPWDNLLLEAGFLTVLIAPLNLLRNQSFRHHDALTFWLARWLLFRLTFSSGVAKLVGYSASWRDLSAVASELESQDNPTPLAWWALQLPSWLLKLAAVGVLLAQIAVPFLYFAPIRCLRLGAFYIQLAHQVVSMLTSNLSILHLLSLALSFSLLDNEHVGSWLGHPKRRKTKTWGQALVWALTLVVELGVYVLIAYAAVLLFQLQIDWEARSVSSKTAFSFQQFENLLRQVMVPSIWVGVLSLTWELVTSMLGCVCVRGCFWKLCSLVQWLVFGAAAVALFTVTMVPYTSMERASSSRVLLEVRRAHSLVERYKLVSSYAVDPAPPSHGGRIEVVLEGSMDRTTWKEIQWMYKPGSMDAAAPLVALYEPRLDRQMLLAARGRAERIPWFTGLVLRILQGKKDVERLLQTDQSQYVFSKAPPTYLRARLYHFTRPDENGSSPKQWWRRVYDEDFYPIVQLGDITLEDLLSRHGLKEMLSARPTPSPDSPLARALKQARGHVEALPGPLVQWSLLATVLAVCLLKSLLSRTLGGRKSKAAPPETKAKKPKEQAPQAEKATAGAGLKAERDYTEERRQEADRSPRKRK